MAAASRQRAQFAAEDANYVETTLEEQLLIKSWPEVRVGFYNVGLLKSTVRGKRFGKTKEKLAKDLQRIFFEENCDMLCLSELGEIEEGLDDALPKGTLEFFQNLWLEASINEDLSQCSESRTSSAAQPADMKLSKITVLCDSHYATLIRDDKLVVERREYISNFVSTQPYRGFQKIIVRPVMSPDTITVLHCHSPSSSKRLLTMNTKRLVVHELHKHSGPRAIWGGDLNITQVQLSALTKDFHSTAASSALNQQIQGLQIVFSHTLAFKPGDLAVVLGMVAFQENSTVGRSHGGVSDAHDLVLVPVRCPCSAAQPALASFGTALHERAVAVALAAAPAMTSEETCRRATQGQALPSHPAEAASDAGPSPQPMERAAAALSPTPPSEPPRAGLIIAQRHLQRQAEFVAAAKDLTPDHTRSAEQHPKRNRCSSATLTPHTDKLMETLAEHEDNHQGLLDDLARFFLFNKLRYVDAATDDSRPLAQSLKPTARLETFLQICEEKRNHHIAKKQRRSDMMPPDMQGMIFDDGDMQEIYNDWLEDFPTWMIPDKQQQYLRLVEAADEKAKEKKGKGKEKGKEKKGKGSGPGQKAHQLRRSAFSAYQFQIIGNKHMVHAMIRTGLGSADQPATQLPQFITSWNAYKESDEYRKALQDSVKKTDEQCQLKAAAHTARRRLQQGSRLQKQLMTDAFMWKDLTTAEQELVNAFANNSLRVAVVKANEAYGFNKETRPRGSSIAVVQQMSRASASSASQPAST